MTRGYSILTSIFLSILSIAVIGGMLWGNWKYSNSRPGEIDFLVPWLAARTFLEFGDSPYGLDAAQRAQIVHYGRLSEGFQDPLFLWLPLPVELFYFPLALINDYDLARSVWLTLNELALITSAFFTIRLLGWKPGRWLLPFILLFPVFWSSGMLSLFTASPAPLIVLALIGSLTLLRSGEDELSGILLFFPLMKVDTYGIFLFFFLWWVVVQRRWRIFAGLGMILAILLLLSFLLLPDWLLPFFRGLYQHFLHDPGLSSQLLLRGIWPVVGPRLGWLITASLVILLFIEWNIASKAKFRQLYWLFGLTLLVTPLMGIPFSLVDLAIFIFPSFFFMSMLVRRWGKKMNEWPALMAGLILLAASWGFLLLGKKIEYYLLLPVVLILGFYWVRWWTIRSYPVELGPEP